MFIKEGYLTFYGFLNFDKDGKIKNDYILSGNIKKAKINYNEKYFNNINFKFYKRKIIIT